MQLDARSAPRIVPTYSLTGDVLSFARCGLQYRYHRIGHLPASRPVQRWFGQFIHGVLEESYRRFAEGDMDEVLDRIDDIADLVADRLRAENLYPRSRDVERLGRERAMVAVRELGPELFPLISQAEVRLTSTRPLPRTGVGDEGLPERYQMAGVVDVITHVELTRQGTDSTLLEAIRDHLPAGLQGEYEVIVDYKGMRRPPARPREGRRNDWEIYEWQVQTYSELRHRQPDSLPVVAGVVIYLNELRPTVTDVRDLAAEVREGTTDVYPESGSRDAEILSAGRIRPEDAAQLSRSFRFQRALRVVPVSRASQREASANFDSYAQRIELSKVAERRSGSILNSWEATVEERTCAACDFRPVCPEYTDVVQPPLPREYG